ncbi:305_t:CDS:2, partial [Scutellospora calospora]
DENVDFYERCFDTASLKSLVFRCRAKTENYNVSVLSNISLIIRKGLYDNNKQILCEQSRIRYTVIAVAPIDYAARVQELHQIIRQMEEAA